MKNGDEVLVTACSVPGCGYCELHAVGRVGIVEGRQTRFDGRGYVYKVVFPDGDRLWTHKSVLEPTLGGLEYDVWTE